MRHACFPSQSICDSVANACYGSSVRGSCARGAVGDTVFLKLGDIVGASVGCHHGYVVRLVEHEFTIEYALDAFANPVTIVSFAVRVMLVYSFQFRIPRSAFGAASFARALGGNCSPACRHALPPRAFWPEPVWLSRRVLPLWVSFVCLLQERLNGEYLKWGRVIVSGLEHWGGMGLLGFVRRLYWALAFPDFALFPRVFCLCVGASSVLRCAAVSLALFCFLSDGPSFHGALVWNCCPIWASCLKVPPRFKQRP
ncbi:UNVERIFIED_CONTAM: hypothetical protein Slati_3751000 [Sesamum latifolium]|uniref:Uncharacterized protein n=1 Tax=Sesamum latifolium TaxID=2727402 RepID=A0AAW2U3N4_9LAMI